MNKKKTHIVPASEQHNMCCLGPFKASQGTRMVAMVVVIIIALDINNDQYSPYKNERKNVPRAQNAVVLSPCPCHHLPLPLSFILCSCGVGIVTLLCYSHNYLILAYQKIFHSYAPLIRLPMSSPGQTKYTLLLLLQVLSSQLL